MNAARVAALTCAVTILGATRPAQAQDWSGLYVGGSIGSGIVKKHNSEIVTFDTNLDGTFNDTVRTAAGADAFSPGFCGGLAVNATAASGCSDDENGLDVGGRVGYDRQFGMFVIGGLLEVSRTDVTDYATAFSTTPAFYSFARDINFVAGFRARAGVAMNRLLIYGTAGPAWGSVGQAFTSSNTANAFVAVNQENDADDDGFADEGVWGYQAGAGVEFRLTGGLSVIGEYLYSSFDNRDNSIIRSTRGTAPATNPFILVNTAGTDLRRGETFAFQALRFGATYRF